MSTTKQLGLNLPFDFNPDKILETATPDQCKIVLITGCEALHALLNKKNELTNEQAYKQAKTEEAERWSQKISQLEKDAKREKEKLENTNTDQVKQLEKEIRRLKNDIDNLKIDMEATNTRYDNAMKQVGEINERELQKIEDAKARVRSEMSMELNKLKEDLSTANTKLHKADENLRISEKELHNTILEAEKTKNDAVETAKTNLCKEHDVKYEALQSKLLPLTVRQAGSATKGKDNEDAFAALLDKAFGPTKPYKRRDKIGNKSGDHIIEWEGITIMIENKKYAKRVPSIEVENAIRDFESNIDCNVLIFVSENSTITQHERPGDLDITHTADGRTAIWMGNFSFNEDKVTYLQMIAQFIRELGVLQMNVKQLEGSEALENYKIRVDDLLNHFSNTKDDLNKLLKLQNVCQSEQKKTWDKLKNEIVSVIARFNRRQADAIGINDNNDGATNGANADATVANDAPTKAKKRRMGKKKKNTMTAYLNKQKKPRVSLEQGQSTNGTNGNFSQTTTSNVCIE